MMELNIEDYELKIIEELQDENDFFKFLDENGGIKLNFQRKNDIPVEKNGNNYFSEDIVLEYLEQISHYLPLNQEEVKELLSTIEEEDSRDKIIMGYLRDVARVALGYLRSGIDYMELIQEGSIAIIGGLEDYKVNYGEFNDYMIAYITRNMILDVNDRLTDTKNGYMAYFNNKKHQLLEHEIVNELEEEELDEELDIDEEIIEDENKLLSSEEEINKKIAILNGITLQTLPSKLTLEEKNIIELYYGIVGDKRESLLEIEDKLSIPRGEGEKKFMAALEKLASGGGRLFRI